MSRLRALALVIGGILALPSVVNVQGLDICGCANFPGLQPFDSNNSATWPPGTTLSSTTFTIPLPPDGILRFSSFTSVNRFFVFNSNARNTPVTILVAGDFSYTGTSCCYYMNLTGARGTGGSSSAAGIGGVGGPGGSRGGDGASQPINGSAIGGAGFGPGGGSGGTLTACNAGHGQFLGVPELIPMMGGAGGGGGCSTSTSATNCSAGGGGGGGGAILIAANGTLTMSNTRIFADGAYLGGSGNTACAGHGGMGSGGAIRLVARRLMHGGDVDLYARGGEGNGGSSGRIRLESVDSSSQTVYTTTPFAHRIVGPTPLANPLSPSVAITAIGGNAAPTVPLGTFGGVDIVLATPGVTSVDVATSGVPSGTTVEVIVKPRAGALPVSQTVPLTTCTGAGDCEATATFNLAAGAYVVEARATFQAQ